MQTTLWVVALVVLALLLMYGMRRGWVNRATRQSAELPDFPPAPADLGTGGPDAERFGSEASGFYVGTTRAGDWQDRIVVGDIGHRAMGTAQLFPSGLLIERNGASALWIPVESFVDARVDVKLANKVLPGVGMLVVTWTLGQHRLDTGFHCDDRQTQHEWAELIRTLVPARTEEER
jgi:hypothetical protein